MVAQKLSTTTVPKSEHQNYRDKAVQFFQVMQLCLQDREWDALFLNGVHATISIADAVTVAHLGRRSTSQSHQDARFLLEQAMQGSEEGRKNSARLGNILNWKHEVEYEPRRFTEKESRQFAQMVERFMEWAQKQLPIW